MEYTEVDISFKEINPFSDILIARLNEIEFESYLEYQNGLKAYIPTQLLDQNDFKEIISDISKLTDLSFTINQIKKKNWNEIWEKSYSPIFINNDCVIRAHFHPPISNVKHEIIITPRMSFGTGHHETTSLMMNAMFDLNIKQKTVLDIGTGTGVLAILASKLGARNIVGIDSDEWAFKNANENAVLNNISNIDFFHADANFIGKKKYDVLLANINRNIILNDIEIYVKAMRDSSEILLSGFFQDDISLILKKTEQLGLDLVVLKNKNKWQMLHLKRT